MQTETMVWFDGSIIGSEERFTSVLILISWLIVYFIGLGVAADDFLCPALLVISKTLRLSQNIAGVTFLAFGNGAPDIFSSLAGIKKERAELVIGELFGAGIFVTSVVAGCIILNNDFKLMERPLMRDIVFYMLATFLTWFIFISGQIKLQHAISFIAIYLFYILIVIFGRIIHKKYRTVGNSYSHIENGQIDTSSVCTFQNHSSLRTAHHHHTNTIYSVTHEENSECCRQRLNSEERGVSNSHDSKGVSNSYDSKDPNETVPILNSYVSNGASYTNISTLMEVRSYNRTEGQWSEFFIHICPIDLEDWSERTYFGKLVHVIKSPIYFLLTITIPVVDYENYKNNWCRILNALHCITGPISILILTGNIFQRVNNIPLVFIVVSLSIIIALSVLLTSTFYYPPPYHWVFGYLGFAVSVVWIYALANAVVDLLQTIGILFGLSDVILGLTVLAWGNSIGDLISNISIARHGFPRMGLSACFGGPLMNMLMGIGLPYTSVLSEKGGALSLEYSPMVSLLYATITFSLVSTLLIILFTGFKSKKFHGIFLITLYFFYLIIASVIEFKFI